MEKLAKAERDTADMTSVRSANMIDEVRLHLDSAFDCLSQFAGDVALARGTYESLVRAPPTIVQDLKEPLVPSLPHDKYAAHKRVSSQMHFPDTLPMSQASTFSSTTWVDDEDSNMSKHFSSMNTEEDNSNASMQPPLPKVRRLTTQLSLPSEPGPETQEFNLD